jgi:4-hydroxy-4-methyl-2-oxoglutarate aldolase
MATETELATVRDRLLGLVSEDRIARVELPRPPADVVAGFLALGDLCSSASDALDALGIGGAVGASVLAPLRPATRLCGPAITIRYGPEGGSPAALAARGERAGLAERDLYGIGRSGDVAVFDCHGYTGASVMGSLSARWARRLGIAGCVVDGAVRDVDSVLEVGVPVLADATGVCVVPRERAAEVLEHARRIEAAEREVEAAIDGGADTAQIARDLRPDRW